MIDAAARRDRRGRVTGPLDERGVALALVLWVLVVVGGAAAVLLAATRFESDASFQSGRFLRAHYAARAGLADAVVRVGRTGAVPGRAALQGAGTGRPPRDGAEGRRGRAGAPDAPTGLARPVSGDPGVVLSFRDSLEGATYRVEVTDLNSRLHVNRATVEMLRSLLETSGVEAGRADVLAQRIRDWIDPDDLERARGAEAEAYRSAGRRRLPRNGPVPSVEELRWVEGMTPEILFGEPAEPGRPGRRLGGVARWLTVHGSGKVNLNTAPPEVLAALPGFTPAVVDVVLELRREAPITSLSQVSQHPRLTGAVSLQEHSIRLLQLVRTGTRLESVSVRSTSPAAGEAAGVELTTVLRLDRRPPERTDWEERIVVPAEARAARRDAAGPRNRRRPGRGGRR